MRLGSFFCLLFALAGISAAQDTNFPAGPQYLITYGSPQFLHSIATPSLSLGSPLASATASALEAGAEAQPASTLPELQGQPDLLAIYYGEPEARQNVSEIEITSQEPAHALPASFIDDGVTAMIDASSLRELGYGVPLAEAASFWKTHKPHAARVYTNRDIARLHGG